MVISRAYHDRKPLLMNSGQVPAGQDPLPRNLSLLLLLFLLLVVIGLKKVTMLVALTSCRMLVLLQMMFGQAVVCKSLHPKGLGSMVLPL